MVLFATTPAKGRMRFGDVEVGVPDVKTAAGEGAAASETPAVPEVKPETPATPTPTSAPAGQDWTKTTDQPAAEASPERSLDGFLGPLVAGKSKIIYILAVSKPNYNVTKKVLLQQIAKLKPGTQCMVAAADSSGGTKTDWVKTDAVGQQAMIAQKPNVVSPPDGTPGFSALLGSLTQARSEGDFIIVFLDGPQVPTDSGTIGALMSMPYAPPGGVVVFIDPPSPKLDEEIRKVLPQARRYVEITQCLVLPAQKAREMTEGK